MATPTVYIESTVISYYAAFRTRDLIMAAHEEITWEWWESVLPQLDPYVSQIVFDEISRGDPSAAQRRVAAAGKFGVLEVTPDVAMLANIYFEALDIPEKARNDSLHLALAACHGMDYLVGIAPIFPPAGLGMPWQESTTNEATGRRSFARRKN